MKASVRTTPGGKRVRNRILSSIPAAEYQEVAPHLEFISLRSHRILHEPHETLEFVHFPNVGLISLVIILKDGKTVEAGLLGPEGVAGLPAVLGLSRSPLREVVQITGDGFRMRVKTLQEVLSSTPRLYAMLTRYAAGLAMQVAQTAACNRLHSIDQRLSRWLLIAHDRVDNGHLAITHDFLGTMLGTDRPTVSLALGQLKKMRVIDSARGSVKIVNRPKLEKVACECYAAIKQYHIDA